MTGVQEALEDIQGSVTKAMCPHGLCHRPFARAVPSAVESLPSGLPRQLSVHMSLPPRGLPEPWDQKWLPQLNPLARIYLLGGAAPIAYGSPRARDQI